MPQSKTIVTELEMQAARQSVWEHFSDVGLLRRACAAVFGVGVVSEGSASPYDASSVALLSARIEPYDILLTGKQGSIAIRLQETPAGGCRMLAAAAYDPESSFTPTRQQIEEFAQLMKLHFEKSLSPGKTTVYRAQPREADVTQAERPTPPREVTVTQTERPEPHREAAPQPAARPKTEQEPAAPKPQPLERAPRKKKKRVRVGWILLCALVAAAIVLGVLFWSDIHNLLVPYKPPAEGEGTIGYAEQVTLPNMLALDIGASEKDVARKFGTEGIQGERGNRIYFGGTAMSDGTYAVRVSVEFEGGAATRYTYLDLEQSRKVGALASANVAITGEMSPEQMAQTIGIPPSMVRRYASDGVGVLEVHFGHTDPFGNFSPAWRGEFVATVNTDTKALSAWFWPAYDGADPLMIEKLQGNPVALQYDSYDQFLNDKYIFERSLYMLNRFSIGDMRAVFGPMELFSTDGGVALYRIESPELLETSGLPAYRMSFGFDSRSQFVMSSFSNLRLFDKPGMLAQSDYNAITRGMSYGEVRELMKILPTAVMINEYYFSLCYGRRLEKDTFEDQFELIISFDIDNNYVQAIYINTGE